MNKEQKHYTTDEVIQQWLDAPDGTEEERDLEYELVLKLCSKFQRRYITKINGHQLNLRAMWDENEARWFVEVGEPSQ